MTELVFAKLGGSLITDKHTPRTPRTDTLARLMREIVQGVGITVTVHPAGVSGALTSLSSVT